jgi:RND family efflux transporter MFP subunit
MRTLLQPSPTRRRAARRSKAALLAAVAAVAALACGGSEPEEAAEVPAPPVEVVRARSGTLPLEERVNGVVKAENQVAVRPDFEGRVVEVMVKSGEEVREGQPLVRLRADTPREQLRQAEADLAAARAAAAEARARVAELAGQATRTRALAAEDLVSEMDLETLEAQLDAARAAAAESEARVEQAAAVVAERGSDLEQTTVRSPVSGRIGRRQAEVGMLVDPSDVLFMAGDLRDLVVEVPLTEEMLGHVAEGQPVRITSSALPGRAIEATLSRISPFLSAGSFSTTGEIDVPPAAGPGADDRGLRPGMFVTVDVLYGESERATLVPVAALWEDPRSGVRGVYVLTAPPPGLEETPPASPPGAPSEDAYPVELRLVEVLAEGRGAAGVAGIEAGEWVVTAGQHLLAAAGDGEGGGGTTARIRPTTWQRVEELQALQREDLLTSFLDRQQRIARSRGAEPPSNEEFLQGGTEAAEPAGNAGGS